MIISFETKPSEILNSFLDRYENPQSMTAMISKNSFLEFKIHRFNDLIIISQKHLFDVVAKWIFMCSFIDFVIAYTLGFPSLFYIGGIFLFVSIVWLSKYMRFFALKYKLNSLGHKDSVTYVNESIVIEKLLLEVSNVAK
jgi:hypothetical protein